MSARHVVETSRICMPHVREFTHAARASPPKDSTTQACVDMGDWVRKAANKRLKRVRVGMGGACRELRC